MTPAQERVQRWKRDPVAFVRDNFKVEPDEWQKDALAILGGDPDPRRKVCMKACTGPGKLLSVETIVPTPGGDRRWGDLRPGDEVFAVDGSPTKIVSQTFRDDLPFFRVTFDDGSSTLACRDHLWNVRGRTERRHGGKWATLSTQQIIDRGVRRKNGAWMAKQFEIPQQGPAQYPAAVLPLDPYLAGVWLGDGSRTMPMYTKPYPEVEDEINRRGYRTTRTPDGKSVRVLGIMEAFASFEVGSLYSYERFIPDSYKHASVAQRIDLLCGLMDTDGCIGKDGHMEFASTSRRLADDVVWLVRSLGGISLIKDAIKQGWYPDGEGGRIECRDCYRVSVTLPFNPFRIQHKAERWHMPQARYLTRYIDRIDSVGVMAGMCIQVEHPSHLYLCNDFIVTHNSAVLSWMGWHRLACFAKVGEHPKGAAVSITADNLKDNLWAELSKWQARSQFLTAAFQWTKEKIYAREHPETWFLSARSFAKDANPEAMGRTLSGLHGQFPFVLLDETGDMPLSLGKAAMQIFTGNPTDAAIIQAGNPTSTTGLLYEACTSGGYRVITITADPDDPKRTPRVSIEHAQEMIDTYGRDNPWVMATILGLFPPGGFNTLLSYEDVQAAMNRHYTEHDYDFAARVLGVDVAREGDDKSVIFPRQGLVAFPPTVLRNVKSIEGAGAVATKKIQWQSDAEFIDNTGGFGGGWIDQLQNLGHSPIPVHFAGEPMDRRYANKRAEMFFLMADWVKGGGAIPNVPGLIEELTAPTYSFKGDRLLLEPKEDIKKRIGRSPDLADALALTFAFPAEKQHRAESGQIIDGHHQTAASYSSERRWL